mmetsp:Transcript_74412/g.194084  ORF Transcript_74412/g.194084 Transcript_74412/m.194084 type:complete len:201 (+) Transcript_74412:89-691(+)
MQQEALAAGRSSPESAGPRPRHLGREALRDPVPTGHPYALWGQRGIDGEVLVGMPVVAARRGDRLARGQEGRGAQKERRLAHRAGRMYGRGVRAVLEQRHPHVYGHVVERGNLVCPRSSREEGTRLKPRELVAAPDHLLQHGPPDALHKGALDLSNVYRWVQTVSQIHEDVCAQYAHIPCQTVDLYLGTSCTIREIPERC